MLIAEEIFPYWKKSFCLLREKFFLITKKVGCLLREKFFLIAVGLTGSNCQLALRKLPTILT
ncbi:MAG: hypothetical protein F6K35_13160 [Okeania sp. SIO2H7]|nr:hypothetical protein [Okeania sp. SIO2H7]